MRPGDLIPGHGCWSDYRKLLDALHGRIDLIEMLSYARRQRPPAPGDERRDMTVLVHPEPVELKSHELVITGHWHDTDAMTAACEPATKRH